MRKNRVKRVMRFLAAGFMILAAAGLLLRSGFTSEAAPEPPITVDILDEYGMPVQEYALKNNDEVFTYRIQTEITDDISAATFEITDTLVPEMEFVSRQDEVSVSLPGAVVQIDAYANTLTVTYTITDKDGDDTNGIQNALQGQPVEIRFNVRIKASTTEADFAKYWDRRIPNSAAYRINNGLPKDSNVVYVRAVEEVVDVPVAIIWDDNDNNDGLRPTAVTVGLFAQDGYGNESNMRDAMLTAHNNSAYVFRDMPKFDSSGTEILYTVKWLDAAGSWTSLGKLNDQYEGTVSGDATGYRITFRHMPQAVRVTAALTWDDQGNLDGLRPNTVTQILYADGVEVETIALSGNAVTDEGWNYTWTNLPKYRDGGIEIVYEVVSATVSDYTTNHEKSVSAGEIIFDTTMVHTHTHTWDAGTVTKPATETEEGVRTFTCSGCGATKTESIAKLAHTHTWDAGTVTKPATETEEGVRTFTCSGCGATKTEPIAKLAPANTSNASSTGNTKSNSANSGTTNTSTSNKTNTGSTTPGRSNASNTGSTNSNRSNTSSTGSTTPGRSNASNTGSTNSNRSNASNTGDTTPSRSNTSNTGSTTPGRSSAANTARTTGAVLGQNRQSNAETGRPLHSHDWVSAVSTAPTSVASGMREFVCLICGETHGESIAQLDCGHAQKGYGQLPLRAVSKSGCGHAGIVCKDCGKIKSTMTTHTYEAFPVSYADGKTDVVYGWFDDSNVQRLLSGGISGAGDPAMLQLDGTVGHIYFSEKYADAKRALPVRNAGTVFHRLIFSEDGSAPREMKILVSY